MKQKSFIALGSFGVLATPFLASAQGTGDLTSFVRVIGNIVNLLVPLVSTLAIVFFFYGLAKYVLNAGDEEKKAEGKNIMIWGVLAMFVLVTIWGIIGFLQKTAGNTQGPANINIDLPDVVPSNISGSPF
jgi:hypothetical protein